MQEVPLYPETKSGQWKPWMCQRHLWQGYWPDPWTWIDAPLMCEPWLENNEGAEMGSAWGSEEARVRGNGLLVTAVAAQAGWLSGVRLRQSAGLGGKGEVQVMAAEAQALAV